MSAVETTAVRTYDGYSSLEVTRLDGDILKITLANPRNKLNAVDGQMHEDLRALFEELKMESEARAILLTGSGRAFSAGGDFEWMRSTGPDDFYAMRQEGKQIVWNLLDVEIPIVAAVNGPAIGLEVLTFASADHQEALRALSAKETPRFEGR